MVKGKTKNKETHFAENFKLFWKVVSKQKKFVFFLFLFSILVEVLMIADNLLIKWIVDYGNGFIAGEYLSDEVLRIFVGILSAFFGLVVFRSGLRYFQVHIRNRFLANVDLSIKKKYFRKVLGFDYDFHTTNKSGALISKLDRGAKGSVSLAELVTQRIVTPFVGLIIVLFSIAYFDIVPALICVGVGVVIIIFSWIIFAKQANLRLEQNKHLDEEKGFVSNILSGFESVKFFGKEKGIVKKHSKVVQKSRDYFVKVDDYYKFSNMFLSFTLGVGTILLLYFSLRSFVMGRISIGTVVFIFATFGRMITPVIGLADSLRTFNESMSDVQELFKYDKVKNEIRDLPGARNLKISRGEVEFRDIDFFYGDKGLKIFDDLNIKIKENESVAIVGSSGAGKSSLLRLLFRLYDPKSGKVLIDGKDIKSIKQDSLRDQMSIVPQEPVLFHDTVYNNIKFSKPSASRDEVMRALKLSSADNFVKKLPNGLNTLVGERGVKLSGGEKQRVAIARALLANKKILVLDEPTSSLDLETENKIQVGIRNLLKGRTSIIIAHRLSTIKDVDRIIVLKNGKIFEQGTHFELLKKKGEYARLWEYQKYHKDE